jgi:hypothetical protein
MEMDHMDDSIIDICLCLHDNLDRLALLELEIPVQIIHTHHDGIISGTYTCM